MRYQVEATWTKECRTISSQTISDEMGEIEKQHAIDNAMCQLLVSLSGAVRGVDPTTIRFELKEIG